MNNDLQIQISRDPRWFPHLLNLPTSEILFSHLEEEDYAKASFLDRRILTPQLRRQVTNWRSLEGTILTEFSAPNYIFHIGHVGSTLISRLLGELPEVLALREPQVLRDLAEISQIKDQPQSPWSPDSYETRFNHIVAWLSRTFREKQRTMIKASSFVSEISAELIESANKALFLYVPVESYLATILAGDGSRQEAMQLAGTRLLRLNKKLDAPLENLWQLSHVQRVALGWLCEMSMLMQTYTQSDKNLILWQDFDHFLADPAAEFMKTADHFDLALKADAAQGLISGPLMKQYSKAPEHDYSPALRQQLLDQARRQFKPDIEATLEWVDNLAATHPLIRAVVDFADKKD